jgi:K+-sensing histidine kinase KdpD
MSASIRLAIAVISIAIITVVALSLGENAATTGFLYLLAILGVSIYGGLWAGVVSAIGAAACYNFFFLPPLHTFVIGDVHNWISLAAFLTTSVVTSRLVTRAREQAAAAEALAAERERLMVETAHVEALREADALKTSILRAVSHDLTTPLTALTLQIERLRKLVNGAETTAIVDGLARDTGRLRRRIENLLAIARVEARTTAPRPEPTPAADLFRAAREHLPLDQRVIDVVVDRDCPEIYVDPSLALEILVNVIENAHQASPPGLPIELSAHASNDSVRIEIADRGTGIRSTTEPSDTARRGLGLEIARALTMTSGGDLLLLQREGGGTIARIDLPAAQLPAIEHEAAT